MYSQRPDGAPFADCYMWLYLIKVPLSISDSSHLGSLSAVRRKACVLAQLVLRRMTAGGTDDATCCQFAPVIKFLMNAYWNSFSCVTAANDAEDFTEAAILLNLCACIQQRFYVYSVPVWSSSRVAYIRRMVISRAVNCRV